MSPFVVSAEQAHARASAGLPRPNAPLCVAYGMGVDSTAMLVWMHARGVRPDLITFADTGDEKPETYAYLPVIQAWLERVGFPPVVVVHYADYARHDRYKTLYENCLANETLPSIAFGSGKKGCSLKFKVAVQHAYRKTWAPAREAWAADRKVVVLIGYDAGPKDSKRFAIPADERYEYGYPLRLAAWSREACEREIAAAGLAVPCKSACFYCPSSTPAEIAALDAAHPDLGDRIMAMEAAAAPWLTAIKGLWRTGCKGTRGSVAKPPTMTEFILARRAGKRLPVVQATPAEKPCGNFWADGGWDAMLEAEGLAVAS